MKRLSCLISLLATAAVCHAGILLTSLNGTTQNITTLATNTYTTECVFPIGSSPYLGIQVTFVGGATNGSIHTLRFDSCMDGVGWVPGYLAWPVYDTNTTSVTYYTNLSVTGLGFVRLRSIDNLNGGTNTAYITNLLVTGYTKPQQ